MLADLDHGNLTHSGLNKMADILQTVFSDALFLMKLFEF